MAARILLVPLLIALLAAGCGGPGAGPTANSSPASIVLLPRSATFSIEQVPQGAVGFTASIKNEGTATITVAHPSICFPADYKLGETRRLGDAHGRSEILLRITRPDGARVTLRDGYLHHFDPGNTPTLTIPPGGTGTFDVGWFFQNARGRWERDDEAARVFLQKGRYRVRMLFRNAFPRAAVHDGDSRQTQFIDVWTGEIESAEVEIEVK